MIWSDSETALRSSTTVVDDHLDALSAIKIETAESG
jgi:hypothetical protein